MKALPKGEVIKTNFFKYVDKRILSGQELIGKGQIEVTIDRVEYHEKFTYENRKTDNDVKLLFFNESPKPIKLNKRKWDTLIYLSGSVDPEKWQGIKIKVNTGVTKFGNKDVLCLIFNDKDHEKSAKDVDKFLKSMKGE